LAVDLQIVFPQESILIKSVTVVPGSSPPAVLVIGQDFSAVDEVLVNEIVVPSYYVVSPTQLYAILPDIVPPGTIQSVSVTSRRLTITDKSFLKFRIGKQPSKVTGILRLVQVFVKVLFTTPGSDIFNKNLGGGALKNLGRTFSKGETKSIVSDFVIAVDNTSRQLISTQSRQPQLPADERLISADVVSATFDMQQSALIAAVEVTSQAGRSATANVVF